MRSYLTIGKASEYLEVSKKSLRLWDKQGRLNPIRTPGGHRRYCKDDLDVFLGKKNSISQESVAVYCRVSSHGQKETGDLERQKLRLLEYCATKSYKIDLILEEVGSGMSATRPKLKKLLELCVNRQITRVVVEHKDRLRFMFESFKQFMELNNVILESVQEKLPESYETELAKDTIAIIASFSGKVHGKRGAKLRKLAHATSV